MNLKIAICDDEQSQIEYIESILGEWSHNAGIKLIISAFSSAESFLFAYEENKDFDILLLDVEMGELSGIDLAKRIRRENNRAEIIFITSHFEFYGEGYEVDALHYLIKPIAGEKLKAVLEKAVDKISSEPPHVIITCEGETMKLYETEIIYVESFLHYISIHTKTGDIAREYRIKESISSFESKLSADFYRIHRSFLISLKNIVRISRTAVIMENGVELPLARGKYDALNEAFIARN